VRTTASQAKHERASWLCAILMTRNTNDAEPITGQHMSDIVCLCVSSRNNDSFVESQQASP
jgi:hypothetical protein